MRRCVAARELNITDMKIKISMLALIALTFFCVIGNSQVTVKVEVSADTVMMGDLVELTYTIENGQGKLVPPDLSGMPIVSGPNSATSMVYANGKMSSSQSFSYILRPDKEGQLVIPETKYIEDGDTIRLEPITIVVHKYFPITPPGGVEKRSTTGEVREKKKF